MSGRGWLAASILYLFCLSNVGAAEAEQQAEPRWLSDWEEGRKAALASGKPLFVVFRCQH